MSWYFIKKGGAPGRVLRVSYLYIIKINLLEFGLGMTILLLDIIKIKLVLIIFLDF